MNEDTVACSQNGILISHQKSMDFWNREGWISKHSVGRGNLTQDSIQWGSSYLQFKHGTTCLQHFFIFLIWNAVLMTPWLPASFSSSPWQPLFYSVSPWIWQSCVSHVRTTTHSVFFSVWLTPLSLASSRFIRVRARVCTFPSSVRVNIPLCGCATLFIYSSIQGHFVLSPPLSCSEWCCNEHGCANTCLRKGLYLDWGVGYTGVDTFKLMKCYTENLHVLWTPPFLSCPPGQASGSSSIPLCHLPLPLLGLPLGTWEDSPLLPALQPWGRSWSGVSWPLLELNSTPHPAWPGRHVPCGNGQDFQGDPGGCPCALLDPDSGWTPRSGLSGPSSHRPTWSGPGAGPGPCAFGEVSRVPLSFQGLLVESIKLSQHARVAAYL